MWSEFFFEKEEIVLDEKTSFCVYKSKPPEKPGPILLLLHGGGYSGLTWSQFSIEITSMIHCQCLSVDLRGHGETKTEDDLDLSAESLSTDVGRLIEKMYQENCPPIHLVGHSMGGAIAVHIAYRELLHSLVGITVIDVVEGTAMEALASMQSFLRSRPNFFRSIPNAIEWCIRSGQVRNVDSAKVSMPGQIINTKTGKLATCELPLPEEDSDKSDELTKFSNPMSISEDEESDTTETFKTPTADPEDTSKKYTWRIDLSKSEKFWIGWFEGLSEKFLNLRVPKQLLLASIDGLDRALTVGQMQGKDIFQLEISSLTNSNFIGKFQMQVLARCGHAVHEDRPHEVAEVISSYLIRNKFAEVAGEFRNFMPAC